MKKQPESTAATRQRIINAFWTLYRENKIEHIRIKEISDLAQINRSTFYQYFTDIYDILHQEEIRIINTIIEEKTTIAQTMSIDYIISEISNLYLKNGDYICILTSSNGDSNFSSLLKDSLLPKFEHVQNISDSLQAQIIFNFGLDGLLSAFRMWYLSKENLPLEDFIKLASQLINKGIPETIRQKSGDYLL